MVYITKLPSYEISLLKKTFALHCIFLSLLYIFLSYLFILLILLFLWLAAVAKKYLFF